MYDIDVNIIEAIKAFFLYGLNPGSCTCLLLQGKYKDAYNYAHPLIKSQAKWESMIAFMEEQVPAQCKGNNFATWPGYNKLIHTSPELQTQLMLSGGLANKWVSDVTALG